MNLRSPSEIAERAIVMSAVAMRASLEATDNPRCPEFAKRIPQWLALLSLDTALDPLETELLNTPYGFLSDSQQQDAYWAAEGASVFCWALSLVDQIPLFDMADHSAVASSVPVLRPEARELLLSPALRDQHEITDFCKTIILIHSTFREERARQGKFDDDTKQGLISTTRQFATDQLHTMNIEVVASDFDAARQLVSGISEEQQKRMAGPYLVRSIAASWLLDGRMTYYQHND